MSNQGFRQIFKWDDANLKQLNDTLRWLYGKVTGRVEMRDLSTETKETIESKADGAVVGEIKEMADQASKDANAAAEAVIEMDTELTQTKEAIALKANQTTVDALSGKVTENTAKLEVTAEQISSTVTEVETLDGRMEEAESRILQTPDEIRMAVKKVELGGRNLLRGTKEMEAAAGDLSRWEMQSVHGRSEGGDGFYQIGWKVSGLTADQASRLKSPLFKLPDGWLGRQAALSCWVKAEDWDKLDGGLEARICLTAGNRSDDYRWARMRLIAAGGGAGEELEGDAPADGQWRRIWAAAELTQEGLRGSGVIEIPEAQSEEEPVYEPAGDETFGIWKQPEDVTAAVGDTVELKIGANGAVKYQWQNSQDGAAWSNSGISGYNTDTLTFQMIAVRYGYVWRCVITGEDGRTLASRAARLIAPNPITKQPESVDAAVGSTAVLKIEADGAKSYQWQNSQDGAAWSNSGISGYNTDTLSVPVTEARYNYLWRCRVTDSAGMIHDSGPAVIRKPLGAATHGWAGWYVKRNADFSLKAPQLEFGSRPTDWSPAPEDTDEKLAELSAELVVQSDEIALRVKQETLDAAIDGVQVGGRNYLRNTSPLKKADWSFDNSSTSAYQIALGTVTEDEATGGLKIVCSNANVRWWLGSIKVTPGQSYVMSVRYRIASGESPIQMQYVYRDAANTSLVFHSSANAVRSVKEEDGWTVRSDVITVPDNAAIDHVRLAVRTGADNTAYTVSYDVRRPKFEAGTKATDWTPAPEDAELAISELTAELSVQAGEISANATRIEKVNDAAQDAASGVAARVTTAEGNISALNGSISSKVSVETFNAQGEALDSRMTLIEQDADTIALAVTGKLDKDAAASGVDTGTDGGVKVTITKDRFDVDVPGEDGDFVLNESGAKVPVLTAERIEAPNVALRHNGPAALYVNPSATSAQVAAGNYYRSLAEACAAISGRYLEKSVTITVQGDTYGDASLDGVYGSGSVTIQGSGNSLIGTLTLKDCGSRIYLYGLTVSQPSASTATRAVWIAGCQYVAMESSVSISGNGGTYALLIEYGSAVWLYGVALYNATYLMYCIYNTHVTTLNLKGGGGTYFAWANGCLLKMAGTRPDGSLRTANAALTVPTDLTALTIDYGSAAPSVPAVSTATYNYLYSDSYRGGWSYFTDDDIRQGYDGKAIYGVIWFDAAAIKSALSGKTIKQVSLRLHMAKGVGRGTSVNVELYGSDVSYDRTAAPGLTASYGSIGETQPDAVNEITIPAAAVSDMVSGKTRALVLKSSDSELYKDRAYSRNYAKFAGSTSATADTGPRLTVVYQ